MLQCSACSACSVEESSTVKESEKYLKCSAVKFCAVQCSAVNYNDVQCRAMHFYAGQLNVWSVSALLSCSWRHSETGTHSKGVFFDVCSAVFRIKHSVQSSDCTAVFNLQCSVQFIM